MDLSNNFSTQTPILVGSNYDIWSMRMQTLLEAQECLDCIESEFKQPNATVVSSMHVSQWNKLMEQKEKESREKSFILSTVDDSIFPKLLVQTMLRKKWKLWKLSDYKL